MVPAWRSPAALLPPPALLTDALPPACLSSLTPSVASHDRAIC